MKEKDQYDKGRLPNWHWRFYPYDMKQLKTAIADASKMDATTAGMSNLLTAARGLLDSLEPAYVRLQQDSSFIAFVKLTHSGQDVPKYMGLYYNLAKAILNRILDAHAAGSKVAEADLTSLRDLYIRYKASLFFKDSWFFLNRYHISDGLFNVFIGDENYQKFSNPNFETAGELSEYMPFQLPKFVASDILANVTRSKLLDDDFLKNDSLFILALKGVVGDNVVIVYGFD